MKSASNWPSVSLSDKIVLRWLGVIVKGSAGDADKAVFGHTSGGHLLYSTD